MTRRILRARAARGPVCFTCSCLPYTDPTTGQWVGEHEERLPDGSLTRTTEWFPTEELARRYARTGEVE